VWVCVCPDFAAITKIIYLYAEHTEAMWQAKGNQQRQPKCLALKRDLWWFIDLVLRRFSFSGSFSLSSCDKNRKANWIHANGAKTQEGIQLANTVKTNETIGGL
jgi:transketolase